MPRKVAAIANYRVSSDEQLLSNSLARQEQSVIRAAAELDVEIIQSWSGSVSSKKGSNIARKDLEEMLSVCKRNPAIKFAIFDELDRFMRAMLEAAYFIIEFKKLGVKIVFASQPNLKTDTAANTLLLMLEAYKAEGSNEERQRKSIAGQTAALLQGRYPFSPKPGYKRGYERGIQEIHEIRGPILQATLISIASKRITPTDALKNFNKTEFMRGRAAYKMDKFRKIITDPFYAGIVEIDKQVKMRNENGLHKALISKEQHLELVRIMDGKKKNQDGPRKNGNPKYPLSNLVSCDLCVDRTNGRYVGFDHGNGKSKVLVYEKYRCRACYRYLTRQELHEQVERQFKANPITDYGMENLLKALDVVWKQKRAASEQETTHIQHKLASIKETITNQVEAATDPSNAAIKEDILQSIANKKLEIAELEDQLENQASKADSDRERFLRFAFNFVENMGSRFLELSPVNRLRCKQAIFPAGFYLDTRNKVYTPEISLLIRLAGNKKDLSEPEKSLLVRVKRL